MKNTSGTRGLGTGVKTVLLVLLLVLALLGVRDRLGTDDVPLHPYAADRATSEESSVAGPVATGGEVDLVAAGLEGLGFFCAQVRSGASARQVWCRASTEADDPFLDPDITVVDLVTTPAGTLGYADVVLPAARSTADPSWSDRLRTVLGASVLALWPDDARAVDQAIESVVAGRLRKDPGDPYPSLRETTSTRHATYRVGDAGAIVVDGQPTLSFQLVTAAVPARWPLSSAHYATTTVAAAPALEAVGADCYGPQQLPCRGPGSNESLEYSTAPGTDQVVMADFFVPGSAPADGSSSSGGVTRGDKVGAVLAAGLPFLTRSVGPAVGRQVLRSRRDGTPFVGIVAQTVVVIEPPRPLGPPRSGAEPVHVSVGVPLLDP